MAFVRIPEVFQPIDHWTRLLKQVASSIGAEIIAGTCEIFPQETRQPGALPYGIRAPGTWNPKTDEVGLIACSSVELILNSAHKRKKKKRVLFFIVQPIRQKNSEAVMVQTSTEEEGT